ncbi:phosphotransferase [Lipingzhangella sp. LS1_29]|uniref:Phosphotransferase n=2 Tax=Lipingzhangella rawalii TaxID=2055835 RepID=A0ABU2H333_9ACTN|nr:phosphotransferase [Lipingzhangella rawalii]
MHEHPDDLDEQQLRAALAEWGDIAAQLDYTAVGFGDHHWTVTAADGQRRFVTVADLDHKEHCGHGVSGRDGVRRGLHRAMDTAAVLGTASGLDFVVAPLPTHEGATVVPLGQRYAVSVFPFTSGEAGFFGETLPPQDRTQVIEMLAALHGTTPPESTPEIPADIPGRHRLEQALDSTDVAWSGGPYAEPAREQLAEHAEAVRAKLADLDRLTETAARPEAGLVVTHGEPHAGNLLHSGGRQLLVDWDTVGLAPPERDLWLVAAEPQDLDTYAQLTGRKPDPSAMALFSLRWALSDLVEFVDWFGRPHAETDDTEQAWEGFTDTLAELSG